MFVRQWAIVFRINIGRKLKAKAYSSDYQSNYCNHRININHSDHLPGKVNRFWKKPRNDDPDAGMIYLHFFNLLGECCPIFLTPPLTGYSDDCTIHTDVAHLAQHEVNI